MKTNDSLRKTILKNAKDNRIFMSWLIFEASTWTNYGFVLLYLEEAIPTLCDSTSAAIGKIDVECAELKPKELMLDWVEYIKGLCMENEMIAHQVRKKGKSLRGCIAVLLAYSFKNQIAVDKAIIKAAKISASRVTFGIPGMAKAKELIRDYYLGGSRK